MYTISTVFNKENIVQEFQLLNLELLFESQVSNL